VNDEAEPLSARRRNLILESAFIEFCQHGYDRTTMVTLARAAKISRTALYQRFPNRETVFDAVVSRLYDTWLERAGLAATAAGSAVERLSGICSAKIDEFTLILRSPFGPQLLQRASVECADVIATADQRYRALVDSLLVDAASLGEILGPSRLGLDRGRSVDVIVAALRALELSPDPVVSRSRIHDVCFVLLVGFGFQVPPTLSP
jgi:AcrR family transcriptional regulator